MSHSIIQPRLVIQLFLSFCGGKSARSNSCVPGKGTQMSHHSYSEASEEEFVEVTNKLSAFLRDCVLEFARPVLRLD